MEGDGDIVTFRIVHTSAEVSRGGHVHGCVTATYTPATISKITKMATYKLQ